MPMPCEIHAALVAYHRRRKDLARRFRPKRCRECGDEIAPGDPLWLLDGHVYCSAQCAACAHGVSYVEDGDEGYLELFEERPPDDLDGLARRESGG